MKSIKEAKMWIAAALCAALAACDPASVRTAADLGQVAASVVAASLKMHDPDAAKVVERANTDLAVIRGAIGQACETAVPGTAFGDWCRARRVPIPRARPTTD